MPRSSRPAPELPALLEETMLLVIQRLIARHPELLAAPEEVDTILPAPPLQAAHRILRAARELADALDCYRELADAHEPSSRARDDRPL
jgi:hypothetical protein